MGQPLLSVVMDRLRCTIVTESGHRGEPTSKRVEAAIQLCLAHPASQEIFNGILAVVEPNAKGYDVVRYFYDLGVRNMDPLTAGCQLGEPPAHVSEYSHEKTIRFSAKRLILGWNSMTPSFDVRLFEVFLKSVLGQPPELDALGGDVGSIVVG